jgi:hypothetical protein
MTRTRHHAHGLTGRAAHAPDLPAPANRTALRPAVRTPWMRLLLSQPAAYSLACGLVAATAGTAAGLLVAGMTRLALWAAVTAGVAAAGLGYRLPQPAPPPQPPAGTAHTASRRSSQ